MVYIFYIILLLNDWIVRPVGIVICRYISWHWCDAQCPVLPTHQVQISYTSSHPEHNKPDSARTIIFYSQIIIIGASGNCRAFHYRVIHSSVLPEPRGDEPTYFNWKNSKAQAVTDTQFFWVAVVQTFFRPMANWRHIMRCFNNDIVL